MKYLFYCLIRLVPFHYSNLQTLLLDLLVLVRAAKLWAKIELWLDDPHLVNETGRQIKGTHGNPAKGNEYVDAAACSTMLRLPHTRR